MRIKSSFDDMSFVISRGAPWIFLSNQSIFYCLFFRIKLTQKYTKIFCLMGKGYFFHFGWEVLRMYTLEEDNKDIFTFLQAIDFFPQSKMERVIMIPDKWFRLNCPRVHRCRTRMDPSSDNYRVGYVSQPKHRFEVRRPLRNLPGLNNEPDSVDTNPIMCLYISNCNINKKVC